MKPGFQEYQPQPLLPSCCGTRPQERGQKVAALPCPSYSLCFCGRLTSSWRISALRLPLLTQQISHACSTSREVNKDTECPRGRRGQPKQFHCTLLLQKPSVQSPGKSYLWRWCLSPAAEGLTGPRHIRLSSCCLISCFWKAKTPPLVCSAPGSDLRTATTPGSVGASWTPLSLIMGAIPSQVTLTFCQAGNKAP